MEQTLRIITEPYEISQIVYNRLRVHFENINHIIEITITWDIACLKIYIADCNCCAIELDEMETGSYTCDQHTPRRKR